MIQGEFEDAEGAEAVGSSHDDFGFVIETLDDTAGKFLARLEIVQQQLTMLPERPSELLHWLDTAAHDLVAPEVEELSGPWRRVLSPELFGVLPQQGGANRLQVVAEQVAKPNLLLGGEVFLALEHAPARLFQQRLVAVTEEPLGFLGAHFVQSLAHLGHDVEPVQYMQGVDTLLADDVQVRLPHIRANE